MLNKLKTTWPQKLLSEVADLNPRVDKSAYRDDLEVSFVPMAAVEAGSGRMEVSQTRQLVAVKKGYTPFSEGDVLFAKITPCMENGKMAVVPKLTNGLGFGSTEFHVLRPHEGIHPRYVYYFVSSQGFRREAAHRMTGAVGQKRVPQSFLEEASIPIPLFDDQQRIVAEIEKQFSRLDEAVASLKRIKANLKRYKAAVLKAAVEGKLTEDWRKQHPNVEPASKLLERILAERRAKWNGKGKYREPVGPESYLVPNLPKAWISTTAEQCTSVITDGEHITPQRSDSGVLLLSARNILDGRLSLSDVDYVPKFEYDRIAKRLVINPDDVLLSCSGTVGRSTVSPENLVFTLVRSVAVLKPLAKMGKYFSIALRSPILQEQISAKKTQTAQANIFQGKIKTLVIPLPPLTEQQYIVAEVERRLSIIDELETTVLANLTRADRLRQSVLTTAFSGQLSAATPFSARSSINHT
jgi:type I restriction enzyme S subunit